MEKNAKAPRPETLKEENEKPPEFLYQFSMEEWFQFCYGGLLRNYLSANMNNVQMEEIRARNNLLWGFKVQKKST